MTTATKTHYMTIDELALAAECEGYAMTAARVTELFLSDELTLPTETEQLRFSEDELQQVREACDRRRWWLPTAEQFDKVRTPMEKRYCREFRKDVGELVGTLQDKPISYCLNRIMAEPTLEGRRVYRAILSRKVEEAIRQAKEGGGR